MARLILFFFVLFYAFPGHAAIIGKEVTYSAAGQVLKGYIAYDDTIIGKRPGVLVVHEWWGHNEYARKRTRMLAGLGFTALAVDMYGNGKQAAHPDEAGKFAGAVRRNMAVGQQRFEAALGVLKKQIVVDPEKIAAIGYCFGGGIVLQMARAGLDLKGVVSFHGALVSNSPAEKGKVKARVLVCNGGDDTFVTMAQIKSFIEEMVTAGVAFQYHSYPGARHSFTNPGADVLAAEFKLPIEYNKAADEQSWQDMLSFFQQIFH